MTHLPNAPLIYTLGLVRFPQVPEIDRFVPSFHDAVRANAPHLNDVALRQFVVEAGPQGTTLAQQDIKFWQFATPDRKSAFILSRDSLVLHTNSYIDNETFIESFMDAFSKLIAVRDIGIAYVTGVAIRYVDLVSATEGVPLDQLLKTSVLPPPFTEVGGLDIVEGSYVGQYRSEKANVRFQVLRNPPSTLPVDLDTPLIPMNGWTVSRPRTDFAVVDTDCSAPIVNAIALDTSKVRDHMYNSRGVARKIFDHIGTEVAAKLWRGAET